MIRGFWHSDAGIPMKMKAGSSRSATGYVYGEKCHSELRTTAVGSPISCRDKALIGKYISNAFRRVGESKGKAKKFLGRNVLDFCRPKLFRTVSSSASSSRSCERRLSAS